MFSKPCPLSVKNAPKIDYKNIKLLKRYISESGRILPSRVTSVSLKKQKEVSFILSVMKIGMIQDQSLKWNWKLFRV